jgi:Ca-activated chloride channel family protein
MTALALGVVGPGAVPSAAAGILDAFLSEGSREARAGIEAYRDEAWVDAMERFTLARDHGDDPGLMDFDLGAAAYRNGDFESALRGFNAALRSAAVPENDAAYNTGNALYRAGQLTDALAAYRAALRVDPGDADARHNYEITLREIEQQQQPQEEEQPEPQEDSEPQQQEGEDGEPQDSNEGNEQEPGTGEPNDGTEERQPDPGSENQPTPPDSTASPPQAGETPPDPERMLSAEEAERLLNALTPQERELIEARLQAGNRKRAEKDW